MAAAVTNHCIGFPKTLIILQNAITGAKKQNFIHIVSSSRVASNEQGKTSAFLYVVSTINGAVPWDSGSHGLQMKKHGLISVVHNPQNTHLWALENPHEIHEETLPSVKTCLWCAIAHIFFF
jgi:hypothetical protein